MNLDLNEGRKIACDMDVSTDEDCAVFYSISFLPTTENRDKAYQYVKEHMGCKTLDDTPCGKTLCQKGYQAPSNIASDALKEIWKIASERFVSEASGNIIAFVDGADARSTFCKVEIPAILENEKIKTINGIDKFEFLKKIITQQQK